MKSKILELMYSWMLGLPHEIKITEAYKMLKKQGETSSSTVLVILLLVQTQSSVTSKAELTCSDFKKLHIMQLLNLKTQWHGGLITHQNNTKKRSSVWWRQW